MKLTDLEPKGIVPPNWASASPPMYIGVSFLCPCPKCRAAACPTCGHKPEAKRLAVLFYPPIDPSGLQAHYGDGWWQKRPGDHTRVSGETFVDLTIAPSIGFESIGHWHGNITNGEVTPA